MQNKPSIRFTTLLISKLAVVHSSLLTPLGNLSVYNSLLDCMQMYMPFNNSNSSICTFYMVVCEKLGSQTRLQNMPMRKLVHSNEVI